MLPTGKHGNGGVADAAGLLNDDAELGGSGGARGGGGCTLPCGSAAAAKKRTRIVAAIQTLAAHRKEALQNVADGA